MVPAWLAHPWWLSLLLALPVLGVLRALGRRHRHRALVQMGAAPTPEPGFTLRGGLRFLRGFLQSTMLTCLVVGIAGPQWGREWGQSGSAGRDVVAVLDLSRSMYARDVQPNRLGRAKESLLDLVANSFETRGGYRVGLVVFAAKAKVLCPLTHDTSHLREVLDRIDLERPPTDLLPQSAAESGTRIGQGLAEAVDLHEAGFEGSQDILLFSDGDDPGADSASERAIGVNAALERRISVHAVGIGDPDHDSVVPFDYNTPNLTRLKPDPLKEIARSTGGAFVPIQPGKTADMGRLFEDQLSRNLREHGSDAIPSYRQRHGWFFNAALVLLGLDLLVGLGIAQNRTPQTWFLRAKCGLAAVRRIPGSFSGKLTKLSIAAAILLLLGAADGMSVLEAVRKGNEAFARRDYDEAQRWYAQAEDGTTEPGLIAYNRAAVAYRCGKFSAAEVHYRQALSDAEGRRRMSALQGLADSLVKQNLGTGPLREAILCYRACLGEFGAMMEEEPDLRGDILNNLELAKLLLVRAEAAERSRGQPRPPDQGDSERSRPDNRNGRHGEEPGDGQGSGLKSSDAKRGGSRVQPQQGKQPIQTEEQAGGAGRLPPVPDKDELVPMTPEAAALQLKAAGDRLMRHLRSTEKTSGEPLGALDR
jgi:Ca-activated chloride channel family protein